MTFKFSKSKLLAGAAASVLSLAISTQAFAAKSDILFILDGSGSMWGQIGGVAKIQTAKETMTKLMDDVPQDARLGLMTYGTTDKKSCTDVTLLNGLGADRTQIKDSISQLKPLGKTPIGFSLASGITTLSNTEPTDVQKSLVLISDGIATCDVDPCAVAISSQYSGVSMKVHVVGFDVDAEARKQLECIAEAGNGQYFNASDTNGFKDAMQAVVEVAQAETKIEPEPEPVVEEPKGPIITEFFRDDFDNDELGEIWAIENPDPDSFIVEDGALTMLSTSEGGFANEQAANIITYTGEMPKGDWDAEITFTGDITATHNRLHFGLMKDSKNYMASAFYAFAHGTGCTSSRVYLIKNSKGKVDQVEKLYRANSGQCYVTKPLGNEDWQTIVADHAEKPMKITLSKRGRNYTSKGEMIGVNLPSGEPFVVETTQFTSLRSPGDLSFQIDRPAGSGEILLNIDSVVINKVEE